MTDPRVSVLMPVYNAERYLREAIDSVLQQTYDDFELIATNDGSKDGSQAILRAYEAADPRVRVISRPNTGMVGALQDAYAVARGSLIARMDADDISLPDRFQTQVDYLDAHPECACVGGDWQLMDARSRILTRLHGPRDHDTIEQWALVAHTPMIHSLLMMRRDAFDAAGGYDPETWPAEDLDLILRLAEVGKLVNLESIFLRVRLHDDSICAGASDLQIEKMRSAALNAQRKRGVDIPFDKTQHWRAGDNPDARYQFLLDCGWWAFNSAQRRTALHYGSKAVMKKPLDTRSWRLLACAAVKPMPTP